MTTTLLMLFGFLVSVWRKLKKAAKKRKKKRVETKGKKEKRNENQTQESKIFTGSLF
jgi:predicted histidine transporter YuiF (NhaC family)